MNHTITQADSGADDRSGAPTNDAGGKGRQDEREEIGKRLRQARELAGLSQGQAAKLMGMHRPTVTEIEAGRRRVSADELKQFAGHYDVSVSWITDGTNDEDLRDARYQLAARELSKLKPDDVDRLLALLAVLKKTEGSAQ